MYLNEIPAILFSQYKDPLCLLPRQGLLTRGSIIELTVAPAKFPNTIRNRKSNFSPFLVLSKYINDGSTTSIEVILSTSIEDAVTEYTKMPSIIRIHCGMLRRSAESDTLHDGIFIEHPDKMVSDFPTVAEACFEMAAQATHIYNHPQLYNLEFRPDKEDE